MTNLNGRSRVHSPPVELPQSNATNFFEEANMSKEDERSVRRKFENFADAELVPGNPDAGRCMTVAGFEKLVETYQCCHARKISSFFKAMDRDGDKRLDFTEFFLGVCAADPQTTHILNSYTGKERTKFIFSFYTDSRREACIMTFDEFVQMQMDLKQCDDQEVGRRDALQTAAELGLLDVNGSFIGFDSESLVKFIQSEQMRGTSRLFRFSKSLLKASERRRHAAQAASGGGSEGPPASVLQSYSSAAHERLEAAAVTHVAAPPAPAALQVAAAPCRVEAAAELDKNVEYETLEWHASLLDWDRAKAPNFPEPNSQIPVVLRTPPAEPYGALMSPAPPPRAQIDVEGSGEDPSAIALMVLRCLGNEKFGGLLPGNLSGNPDEDGSAPFMAASAAQFRSICGAVAQSLQQEEMVVKMSSLPVKVFGALHGQLLDLLSHFKWTGVPSRGSPLLNDGDLLYNNYLFLGDYADRGGYSLEVLLVLFCLKVVRPNGVFLLRGHHENRHCNRFLGLWDECIKRLGNIEGTRVYDCLDRVFERMPLAAVVHDRFLALGAGVLPESLSSVDQLRRFQKPLQLPHALQPRTTDDAGEQLLLELFTPWALLGDRATPDPIPPNHLDWFCAQNGLSAVIVGHRFPAKGYSISRGGRLISITSCLNYCDELGGNDACVLQIMLRTATDVNRYLSYRLPEAFDLEVRLRVLTARVAPIYNVMSQVPGACADTALRWPKQVRASTPGRTSQVGGGGGTECDDGFGDSGVVYMCDGKVEALRARPLAGYQPFKFLPAFGPGRPPGGRAAPRRRELQQPQSLAAAEQPPWSMDHYTMSREASGITRRPSVGIDTGAGETTARRHLIQGIASTGGINSSSSHRRISDHSPEGVRTGGAMPSRAPLACAARRVSSGGRPQAPPAVQHPSSAQMQMQRGPSRPPGPGGYPKAGAAAAVSGGVPRRRTSGGVTDGCSNQASPRRGFTRSWPETGQDVRAFQEMLHAGPSLTVASMPSSPSRGVQVPRIGELPLVTEICRMWVEAGLTDRQWTEALKLFRDENSRQPINVPTMAPGGNAVNMRDHCWTFDTFSTWIGSKKFDDEQRSATVWQAAFDIDRDSMISVGDFLMGLIATASSRVAESNSTRGIVSAMVLERLLLGDPSVPWDAARLQHLLPEAGAQPTDAHTLADCVQQARSGIHFVRKELLLLLRAPVFRINLNGHADK